MTFLTTLLEKRRLGLIHVSEQEAETCRDLIAAIQDMCSAHEERILEDISKSVQLRAINQDELFTLDALASDYGITPEVLA